jgi:hypothetical protein
LKAIPSFLTRRHFSGASLCLALCLLHLLGSAQAAHADEQTTCRVRLWFDTKFQDPTDYNSSSAGNPPPGSIIPGTGNIAYAIFDNVFEEVRDLDSYHMRTDDMWEGSQWHGFGNNVSSIEFEHVENGVYVPGCVGWTAILYDEINLLGASIAVTGSLEDLDDIGWNDRASSFQLMESTSQAGPICTVELYEHWLSGDTWGGSSRVTPDTYSSTHGAGKISSIRFGGECGTSTVRLTAFGMNPISFSNADGPVHSLSEYGWNDRAAAWTANFSTLPDPSPRGCILRMFGDSEYMYTGKIWAVAGSQTTGTINGSAGAGMISGVAFEGDCGDSEVIFYDGNDQTGNEAYVRVADGKQHPLWLSDWNDKPQSWTANFVSGPSVPTASGLSVPVYVPCEVRLYDGIGTGTVWGADIDQATNGVYSSSDGAGNISSVEFRGAWCNDTFLQLYDVDPSQDADADPYVIKVADGKIRDLSTLGFSDRTQYWSVHFSDEDPTPSQVPNVVDMMYTDGVKALSRMFYRPVADPDHRVTHAESRVPDGKILWTSYPGGRSLPAGTPLPPGSAVHYTKYAHPSGPPPPAPPAPPPGPVVTFEVFPGKALDIGAHNGPVWAVGTNNNVYREFMRGWQNKGGEGAITRMDVGGWINWFVDEDGNVLYWHPEQGWGDPLSGGISAQDIGYGGGEIWIAGSNPPHDIQRFEDNTRVWAWDPSISVPGGAKRIDVDKNGNPWVVNQDGQIYRHLTGGWGVLPGSATDIGCGHNGDVWIVGTNPVAGGYEVFRWNEGSFDWDLIPDIGGVAVSVSSMVDGEPWIAAEDGTIYFGTLNARSPVVQPPASHRPVPDVTGMTTAAAVLAIENAGYEASDSVSVFTTDADLIDTIESTTPAGGDPLGPGNTVSYVYRRGLTYVLNGPSSVELQRFDAYVDEGLSVVVEPGGEMIETIYGTANEVDVSALGTYQVYYYSTDDSGAESVVGSRTVTVNGPTMLEAHPWSATAAVSWGNGGDYFFGDLDYLRFDIATNQVSPGYPLVTAEHWANWPQGFVPQAAVNLGNGALYFFSSNEYLRFDIATNQVSPGYPLVTAEQWANWPQGFVPQAAVNLGNGSVYFFSDDEYLRFDIAADQVSPGYPLVTAEHWANWPAGFVPQAAVNQGDGSVYFFDNSQYMRFNIAADRVDDGYPLSTPVHWSGWPQGWAP